jgi:hypothetical protein
VILSVELCGWNCSLFLPKGDNCSVGFDVGVFVVDKKIWFDFPFLN